MLPTCMPSTLFTVGLSNHSADYFAELLDAFGFTCVVDVRSTPMSVYNPQFNWEPLDAFLKNRGILYGHWAAEFGARHTDPALLDADGRVEFDIVSRW